MEEAPEWCNKNWVAAICLFVVEFFKLQIWHLVNRHTSGPHPFPISKTSRKLLYRKTCISSCPPGLEDYLLSASCLMELNSFAQRHAQKFEDVGPCSPRHDACISCLFLGRGVVFAVFGSFWLEKRKIFYLAKHQGITISVKKMNKSSEMKVYPKESNPFSKKSDENMKENQSLSSKI